MAITLNASTSSGLVQTADTSGVIELQNNGTTKLTVNSSGVNIGQYSAGTSLITSGTAVSASGTSVDFTGIPSWVKRITVMFNGVSTNGTSPIIVRVGTSSGIVTTGYNAASFYQTSPSSYYNITTASFPLTSSGLTSSGSNIYGAMTISSLSSTIWTATSTFYSDISGGLAFWMGGSVSFSGTLDRVRLTTTNGTDTFDNGSINILYE